MPGEWRMGNRPNLNQMQSAAAAQISDDIVKAKLLDEIGRLKILTSGASALGVRVHSLPNKPRDIEDDGLFHYAVLAPSAASDSGKPSAEAKRYLDETTGPEKPRVFRNAVLLLAASRDGLEVAQARIRDYLAWDRVRDDLTAKNEQEKKQKGSVDVARLQTLAINIDKAKGRVPDAIRQAYCIVVTVSDKDDAQAFKITVTDEPHFETIKNDPRSRVQDTAITAEALLPDGPYNLWKGGETARRVKDLAGAFAQLPHLPKMLKSQAIVQTLVDGCMQGTFVLRVTRPDRTFRTWWRSRPDDAALTDPALELVLPEAAELGDIPAELLAPKALPSLWSGDEITAQAVQDYFGGKTVVQVDKGSYQEPVHIPKAATEVTNRSINDAVAAGQVWLLSGPASLLGEPIPAGVLTPTAKLKAPPAVISAPAILPENLPTAWQNGTTSCAGPRYGAIASRGQYPAVENGARCNRCALQARFIALADDSGTWPCDFSVAQAVKMRIPTAGKNTVPPKVPVPQPNVRAATGAFEPAQIQDLGDLIPKLLEIKAKAKVAIKFHVRLEVGDGKVIPPDSVIKDINTVLKNAGDGFQLT